MSGWIEQGNVTLGHQGRWRSGDEGSQRPGDEGSQEGNICVGKRILTPTYRNCRSGNNNKKRYKRYRNEATKWHKPFSEGGSLPRKYVVAGRRNTGSKPPSAAPAAERQPESDGTAKATCKASNDDDVPVPMRVLSQDIRTNPPVISFGGSGARFGSLRNRRGVRAGQDGLVQKRLVLNMVNGVNGRFSLSIGGKRKVDESES